MILFQQTYKHNLARYKNQVNTYALSSLKGLPFYNWESSTISRANSAQIVTDFNHAIGLPEKNGVPMPLFDYEQMLYNALQLNKHIWIKKATGLGVTEFILRYMAWLCLKDNTLSGSQMCIVVGPNIEKAIELIKRLKDLFLPKLGVTFDTKETVIELNGVHIEAYPSHHIDAMRSLTSPRFILIDEGDFFPPGQQQDARDVSERYIAKSNP
jgi:hypothetical protein